jgi:cytochrome oxidase Cu insertion factor (SCO1/SenC/PrrC family)
MRTLPRRLALLLIGAALTGCVNNANTTRSTSHKPANAGKPAAASKPTDAGKPAPEIAGIDADGKKFFLSDYRGKVVLLDFWAST